MKTTHGPFIAGDRVQLHPCTDLWMRGDRFGTVERSTRKGTTVTLDKSGKTIRLCNSILIPIDPSGRLLNGG